jgi:hypothetical protein
VLAASTVQGLDLPIADLFDDPADLSRPLVAEWNVEIPLDPVLAVIVGGAGQNEYNLEHTTKVDFS